MANIYLYHGSNQVVKNPHSNEGGRGRDFGVCFYTTYSRRTAKNWADKNFPGKQVVNKYSIDLERLTDGKLKVKRFTANEEWAEFVWKNRYDEKFKRPDYDIIIGPVADRGLKAQFMRVRKKKLTAKYNLNYESAIEAIMNSMVYARLLSDDVFLDEGDIYLFGQLEKELTAKGIITKAD